MNKNRRPHVLANFASIVLAGTLTNACKTASPGLQLKSDRVADGTSGELEGVVAAITGNIATFSTAKADYAVGFNDVSPEIATKLRDSHRLRQRIKIALPPAVRARKEDNILGIRPDCGEQPLAYNELTAIADNSPDIVSFLTALPPATMQTFTFVHRSLSPLKDEVDIVSPRVLRASADLKLMLAYTCNPQGAHYNHAELIRFDDTTNEFKFSEIDFTAAAGAKIRENPAECQKCHAPTRRDVDPRPNWQMYFTWDGVYGIHDDQVGGKLPDFTNGRTITNYMLSAPRVRPDEPRPPELAAELVKFKNFRKTQDKDPCFAALPWPKGKIPEYDLYPYTLLLKPSNYHVRSNLRITEGLAHLMGHRMARKFSERPQFRPLRYIAAMEAMSCPMDLGAIDQRIKATLPNYNTPRATTRGQSLDIYQDVLTNFDPRLPAGGGPRLFAMGMAFGFAHADWTMNFNRPADPVYQTGISADRASRAPSDVSILKVAQSVLIDQLAEELPALKGTYKVSRGESENFGQKFQCVDNLGGQVYATDKTLFCKTVAEAMIKNAAADREAANAPYTPRGPAADAPDGDNVVSRPIETDRSRLDAHLVETGRELTASTCETCHGAQGSVPQNLRFFKTEAALKAKMRGQTDGVPFLRVALDRLDDQEQPMPPEGTAALTEQEKQAIAAYLNDVMLR